MFRCLLNNRYLKNGLCIAEKQDIKYTTKTYKEFQLHARLNVTDGCLYYLYIKLNLKIKLFLNIYLTLASMLKVKFVPIKKYEYRK